jgi:hypothetical protein
MTIIAYGTTHFNGKNKAARKPIYCKKNISLGNIIAVKYYSTGTKGEENMQESKVYFSEFRAHPGTNLLQKLKKLMLAAGPGGDRLNNQFVP